MIEFQKKPYKKEDILKVLHPFVKDWFFSKFKSFSLPQLYGVMEIHNKSNILVSAPTGGTKTLTAFLSILNELVILSDQGLLENKTYCIYISPLKALGRDVEKNLKEPLKEIKELAKKKGKNINIRIAVRTGDTSQSKKQKMLKQVPHILITTPESLAILLSSYKFIEHLKNVWYLIIDEIHALAENKRGVHLSLSVERLQHICTNEITRIGLSATVAPIQEIAKFLVGSRPCKIAQIEMLKRKDLKVICPVKDLINTTQSNLHNSLYNLLDNLIQEHKTTLIFTNTRSGTERVIHYLKTKFPKKYIENLDAHHGSLSKKHRLKVEEKLRKGELKCVACSTSLELGIDIGYIDLVVCIGSPKSVARFLQRVGRSGHQLQEKIKGRIIVLDRDDLIECSVLLKSAIENKIDKIHIPENCLDVLAQQIYGMAIQQVWDVKDLFNLIKKSYCYKNLKISDFESILSYLSGEYVPLQDRKVYAKIWWDKEANKIGKKGKLSRVIYMTNIGTIPEESMVLVKNKDEMLGVIEESFLERLRKKDLFVLGGKVYEFQFSRGMVAQVKPAIGKLPTVPSWFSEILPLSFDLSLEIQKFRRYLEDYLLNSTKEETIRFIHNYLYVDENAALAIYNYFKEQFLYAKIPNDKTLLLEYYKDENNKKYIIFHSLYGRRVNEVLARLFAYAISKLQKKDVQIGINDNGFFLTSKQPLQVLRALRAIKPERLQEIMNKAIDKTEILSRRFRHCAARALMILRFYKGHKKRVGKQQVSSMILMKAIKQIDPNFSILKEAKREVLEDLMDIKNAKLVLEKIKNREIELKQIHTQIPSPFAFNLITQSYTDILKMEDKLEFLKKMHNIILAKISLK